MRERRRRLLTAHVDAFTRPSVPCTSNGRSISMPSSYYPITSIAPGRHRRTMRIFRHAGVPPPGAGHRHPRRRRLRAPVAAAGGRGGRGPALRRRGGRRDAGGHRRGERGHRGSPGRGAARSPSFSASARPPISTSMACLRPTPGYVPTSFRTCRPTPIPPQRTTLRCPLRPSLLALARPRRQNAPKRSASGRGRAPIRGRGPVCLTDHEPSSTLPLDEQGRLKSFIGYVVKECRILAPDRTASARVSDRA